MADVLSPEQRHKNMSNIRSIDTKPEELVRKYLFSMGFRFRKNDKRYPGKPDIVLPRYHTVVFVHGCFWHQHPNCQKARLPKTNLDYWVPKLNRNIERDRTEQQKLKDMGWHVIVVWSCEISNQEKREERLSRLAEEIRTAYRSQPLVCRKEEEYS